jgi:hypothetical protein
MTTEKLIPSYEIPMPAITICSPVVVKKEFYDHLSFAIKYNTTYENCAYIFYQTCSLKDGQKMSEIIDDELNFSLKDFENCSPKFDDFIYRDEIAGERINSDNFTSRVVTNYGFCYSLNLMEKIFDKNSISEEFKKFGTSKDFGGEIYEESHKSEEEWMIEDGYK